MSNPMPPTTASAPAVDKAPASNQMPAQAPSTGQAPAENQAAAFLKPDVYRLHGHELHVVYMPVGAGGLTHFSYQDAVQTLNFTGDQVRTLDTEIGTLVSVTIRMTVDTGSTEFSVLIPTVNLGPTKTAHIETEGITTIHRFSLIPSLMQGQTELYSCKHLTGTADSEIIPL